MDALAGRVTRSTYSFRSERNSERVRASDERKQVVFAHRIKLDVFDENNFARVGIEDRVVNDLFDALAITLR